MQTVEYAIAQEQLGFLITQVTENHEPLCITSSKSGKAVLLAEEDYRGLIETLYLLNNPVNAEKLLQAAQRTPEQAIAWDKAKIDLGL